MRFAENDPRRGNRGEQNGMCKLTDSDVILIHEYRNDCRNDLSRIENEIYRLREAKKKIREQMRHKAIAEKFDVSEGHVREILAGRRR